MLKACKPAKIILSRGYYYTGKFQKKIKSAFLQSHTEGLLLNSGNHNETFIALNFYL